MRGLRDPVAGGALTGLLAALSLPPFPFWWMGFLAPIPAALALGATPERERCVLAGLVFGVLFWGISLAWVPVAAWAMHPSLLIPALLMLLLLTGVGGLFFLTLHHLLVARRWSPVLALPAAWGSLEFLLSWFGPLAFPWTPLGLALSTVPEVAGIAEVAGVHGLTLWMTGVAGGVAWGVGGWEAGSRRSRPSLRLVRLALPLLAFLLPVLASLHRTAALPLRPLPAVALVQLEIPPATLRGGDGSGGLPPRDAAALAALHRLLPTVPEEARILLLPEAPFTSPWRGEVGDAMGEWVAHLGRPLLVGRMEDVGDRRRNAYLLVDGGAPAGTPIHEKRRLVPAAEWPGVQPGVRGGVVEVEGVRLGALICFESGFGSEGARLRRGGAELLVNPTIDAWPGPPGSLFGGQARAQHRGHLILRAVEGRVGAVRAPLGGEALVVDPAGRVRFLSPAGVEGVHVEIPLTSDLIPLRARVGDLGGGGALLLLLFLTFFPMRLRRPSHARGAGAGSGSV